MSSWATIRDAVQAEWATVSGVGDVYNYRRYITKTETARSDLVNTVSGKVQIAFADIDLQSASLTIHGWGNGTTWDVTAETVLVGRAIRSQKDGDTSGATFGVLLWDLLLAASKSVARVTGDPSLAARVPVEIVANDLRDFGMPGIGGAVCHYGEILIRVPNLEAV